MKLERKREHKIVQRDVIDGVTVVLEGQGFITFKIDDKKYHLNLDSKGRHVTYEGRDRCHYFFKGEGQNIEDIVGKGKRTKN